MLTIGDLKLRFLGSTPVYGMWTAGVELAP